MRLPLVIALMSLTATACGKDRRTAPAPPPTGDPRVDTAVTDALLALATADTRVAVVASGRGLELAEAGLARLRALVAAEPALAPGFGPLLGPLPYTQLLAESGHVRARGLAWFNRAGGDVFVFAVEDRARFVAARGGTQDPDGWDTVGDLSCRPHGDRYACSSDRAGVEQLGSGSVGAAVAKVGARGDVEVVVQVPAVATTAAIVLQLDPGQIQAHAHVSAPVPPSIAAVAPAQVAPLGRDDVVGAAGIALDVDRLAETVGSETPVGRLFRSLSPQLTLTVRPGERLRGRTALRDPAPLRALMTRCAGRLTSVIVAEPLPSGCRLNIDGFPAAIDVRVADDAVELSMPPAAGAPAAPPLTAAGAILLGRPWHVVTWGRGTVLAGPTVAQAGANPVMLALLARLAELGLGVHVGPDHLRLFVVIRTIDANPPEVVKDLDGALAGIDRGIARDDIAAIAARHPSSPFALDLQAGELGPTLPAAVAGMVAAVALPAFVDYQQRGRLGEAELNLRAIARSARAYHAYEGGFPPGTVPLTPNTPCCARPEQQCDDPSVWYQPVWDQLDFLAPPPHRFQYSYTSTDGRSFVATAVGDLDCDGELDPGDRHELRGEIDATGAARLTLDGELLPER
ncbi:MAG TPA: hypothetical protein VM734_31360 [Kofleriaceae bacterium]|nr:hypothetical protein [Kofleriaceae bacterium]